MCEGETSGCPFTYFNDRTSNFFLKFDVRFSLSKRLLTSCQARRTAGLILQRLVRGHLAVIFPSLTSPVGGVWGCSPTTNLNWYNKHKKRSLHSGSAFSCHLLVPPGIYWKNVP